MLAQKYLRFSHSNLDQLPIKFGVRLAGAQFRFRQKFKVSPSGPLIRHARFCKEKPKRVLTPTPTKHIKGSKVVFVIKMGNLMP